MNKILRDSFTLFQECSIGFFYMLKSHKIPHLIGTWVLTNVVREKTEDVLPCFD